MTQKWETVQIGRELIDKLRRPTDEKFGESLGISVGNGNFILHSWGRWDDRSTAWWRRGL